MKLVACLPLLVACAEPAPPPPVTVTWQTIGQHPAITDDRISALIDMRDLETDQHHDGANIRARDGVVELALDPLIASSTVRVCVNLYYSSETSFGSVQDPLGVGACANLEVDAPPELAFTLHMPDS